MASSSIASEYAEASGAGGRIEARHVPLSPAAQIFVSGDASTFERVLTGGDDYEILAAIRADEAQPFEAAAKAAGIRVSRIGEIGQPGGGLAVVGSGRPRHEFRPPRLRPFGDVGVIAITSLHAFAALCAFMRSRNRHSVR